MKKYFAFFKMRLLAGLQYRAAAIAGLSTQIVWGTMEILLYRAFYLEAPEKFPMGIEALSSYIWLQQALLTVFAIWQWEFELMSSVQSGAVACELTRPINLYGMWFARTAALRLSRAALRCWPIFLVGALLPSPYGLRIRVPLGTFCMFLVSLVLMLTVVCAYTLFVYAVSFHFTDINGFRVLSVAAADLLGGGIIPLPFMPRPIRTIAALSPFGAMQNVPLRVFSGDLAGTAMLKAIGLQLFWSAALITAGALVMRVGIRKTVIAGG